MFIKFLAFLLFFIINLEAADNKVKEKYKVLASETWKQVFWDDCTEDWQKQWFLDGDLAKVTNCSQAMTIDTAKGFAVLWTQQEFEGDLRIEYEFKRDDDFFGQAVNIIYIQATGDGEEGYDEDITKWSDKRTTAKMSDYFLNMHTYHMSYAAYAKQGGRESEYIRMRRYLPLQNKAMKNTKMIGEYTQTDLFEDKQWVHVTIIKKAKEVFVEFKHPKKNLLCHFKNEDKPGIDKGRIGLRLMPNRLSRFKNFKVFEVGDK